MTQPGTTRSARQPTHLLHTPDTFVRTPMPEIRGGSAIVHASPALGAGFLWFTVELEEKGTLAPGKHQHFLYILEGEGSLSLDAATREPQVLRAGCFAYLPAHEPGSLTATTPLRAIVIEKQFEPSASADSPHPFAGEESAITAEPLNGDLNLMVRALVPPGFTFDFAVNTMTYAPGAMLSQVEIHYMEHGLLMLEGSGTYLLNDRSYEVQAGDFIWMQAYCPQWFQASGESGSQDAPAKYIIYKNFNRKPSL